MLLRLIRSTRFARLRRWTALLTCVSLLVAGVAYAGHVHKSAPTHSGDQACSLCAQLDRVAGAPTAAALPVRSTVVTLAPIVVAARVVIEAFSHSYFARGPPRA